MYVNDVRNLRWCTQKENCNFEETKAKLSAALKCKTPWNKGKKHSEETKRKMSEKHKGYKFSDESKLKMRKSAMGRIISQEQRNKISLSLKNYYLKSREV